MTIPPPRLILASRSPRRRELLAALGLVASPRPADLDETPLPGETPIDLVRRLAERKAATVHTPGTTVLAGDTVVTLDDTVLGQPGDRADARRMLAAVRGRTVEVLSHTVVVGPDGAATGRSVTTAVRMRDFDDDEVARYLDTGEADDKAGALAVQGGAADLTAAVLGCWSNVVGLPVCATVGLLTRAGLTPDGPSACRGLDCLPQSAPRALRPSPRLRPRRR